MNVGYAGICPESGRLLESARSARFSELYGNISARSLKSLDVLIEDDQTDESKTVTCTDSESVHTISAQSLSDIAENENEFALEIIDNILASIFTAEEQAQSLTVSKSYDWSKPCTKNAKFWVQRQLSSFLGEIFSYLLGEKTDPRGKL